MRNYFLNNLLFETFYKNFIYEKNKLGNNT